MTVVRLDMSMAAAAEAESHLTGRPRSPLVDRLLDQLWLASLMREQRRKVRIAERPAFTERCDSILAALDPPELADRFV